MMTKNALLKIKLLLVFLCFLAAHSFRNVTVAMYRATKLSLCPSPIWFEMVREHYPCLKHFVDVGANKGYTAREIFSMWAPEFKTTSGAKWFRRYRREGWTENNKLGCGSCRDCCDTNLEPSYSSSQDMCSSALGNLVPPILCDADSWARGWAK